MKLKLYEVSCSATLRCMVNAENEKEAKKEAEDEMVGFLHFLSKGDSDTSVCSPVEKLKVEEIKD